MKSTTDFHREALDQALRIALGTSQPALRRQALTRATNHLIHPKLILESALLTDAHPWRREALVISDALEAVTNGMEEPGVLEALEGLPPESPFQDWRHLVLALHFFYEHLDEAVAAHLEKIGPSSPLQALVRPLRAIVHAATERLSPAQRRLAEQVAQPDPLVQQWIQDVAEGLETEDEELFWSALADWLEHVSPTQPERARSAVLWAWNQLEWRDFDEAVLLDLASNLWGAAESFRLAALGSLPWDPEAATLLWLRFLLTAVRDGCDPSTVTEGRVLLDRFREAAECQGGFSPDSQDIWSNLIGAWNAEVRARGWTHATVSPEANTPVATLPRPSQDGQLDLFA